MIEALTFKPNDLDAALLLVRLVFGFTCFMHGYGKLANGVVNFAADWQLPMPTAWLVALTQVFGGLSLMAGAATFWAAFALALLGAVVTWLLIFVAKEPFIKPGAHSWHMGLVYTLLPVLLMFTGPGRFSVDAWLMLLGRR